MTAEVALMPAQSRPARRKPGVSLRLDTTGLAPGRYGALVCLFSKNPRNRFVILPASMDVSADGLFADGVE